MRIFFGILSAWLFTEAVALPAPPMSMVEIPAGFFYRGASNKERLLGQMLCFREWLSCSDNLFRTENPSRSIYLSSYWISITEVSQKEYQTCVAAGSCRAPTELGQPKGDDLPVSGVSWQDARDYCAFIGGRLPTEAEWEKAARGKDGRIFPWGDTFVSQWVNHGQAGPPAFDSSDGYESMAPVNSMKEGASPFGLLHMSGNVWEWVEDEYLEEAYLASPAYNPLVTPSNNTNDSYRIVRGGSYLQPLYTLRTTYRGKDSLTEVNIDVGFRCAR